MKNKVLARTVEEYRVAIRKAAELASSTRKKEITRGFTDLSCLAYGGCIRDIDWGDDYLVYEFTRCHIPTRLLQFLKDQHVYTKRWEYVKPLYEKLHRALLADLDPDTPVYSNRKLELVDCMRGVSEWNSWLEAKYDKLEDSGRT